MNELLKCPETGARRLSQRIDKELQKARSNEPTFLCLYFTRKDSDVSVPYFC